MVILRTLLENNLSRNRALTAEHGLSFLVETGDKKILFDCSAGKAARKNAEKMHVSLKDVDYVILSHSHYDHAGGYMIWNIWLSLIWFTLEITAIWKVSFLK